MITGRNDQVEIVKLVIKFISHTLTNNNGTSDSVLAIHFNPSDRTISDRIAIRIPNGQGIALLVIFLSEH